jgi:hypothetical protein
MKLCLSVYLTLLNLCRAPMVNKSDIGRKVLSSLNEEGDETFYSDSTVSDLSHGKKNLGGAEVSFAIACIREQLSKRMAERVLPLIDENKAPQLLAAFQRVVAEDDSILPKTEVDLVSHWNKEEFIKGRNFVLPDVLAGTLIYCVVKVPNRDTGHEASKITPGFLSEVQGASRRLVLQRRPASSEHEEVVWRKGPNSLGIVEGDLFSLSGGESRSIVVIPVDSSFSTRLTTELGCRDEAGISENTLHGKWLKRCSCDAAELDARVVASLGHKPLGGKRGVGDLAILDDGMTTYFLLAVSVIENGVARSDAELVRKSIESLLIAYDEAGQGYPMYLPLIGSGRSRAGLGYKESLRLILQTTLENEQYVQGKIVVVVQPGVLSSIDLAEVRGSNGL